MKLTTLLQSLSVLAALAAAAPQQRYNHYRPQHGQSSSTSCTGLEQTAAPTPEVSTVPAATDQSDPVQNADKAVASSPVHASTKAAAATTNTPVSTDSPNPSSNNSTVGSSTGGLVFAHYMLITRPPSGDYATDMIAAKAMGIDAFAVNYGGFQTNYEQQNAWLTEFYGKAAANGMKAFLSIDTTIGITPDKILNLTKTFTAHPAALKIDGQPLLTSFELGLPTTWNWKNDILSKVSPTPMFIGCSLSASGSNTLSLSNSQGSSGSLTWLQPTLSADDQKALDISTAQHKGSNKWIAAVAPWYFKRLSADMNWAQAQDDAIFVDRFTHLLTLSPRPDYIELVTWNDWGEGHYIGYGDDKNECKDCYYAKLNHTGFQQLAQPFIRAFKTGATAPVVEDEDVFMFYRTQKASVNDNSGLPLPKNASSLKDEVFVVGALKQPATVTLVSGTKTTEVKLGAGVQKTGVPFEFGAQKLSGMVAGRTLAKSGPTINEQVDKVNDNIVIV